MEHTIFKLFLYIAQLLRAFLTPLMVSLLYPFSERLRGRLSFELQNLAGGVNRSFNKDGIIAEAAFEVSSEGEFEQIKPILDHYLYKGSNIELIYSSDSLEKKIVKLASAHGNLRVLRLPIVSFNLFESSFFRTQSIHSWLSSPFLILCRYDFFPELLLYGSKKGRRFALVSATLKNKNLKNWWLRHCYKLFDYIMATGPDDNQKLAVLGIDISKRSSYEFRMLQIARRLKEKEQALKDCLGLISWLEEVPRSKRIIMGSAWPNELSILKNAELLRLVEAGELRILIIPHSFEEDFSSPGLDPFLTKKDSLVGIEPDDLHNKIILLRVRGILLEIYSYFGHAFVGGGHGRSVHSLLEPYLAGCHVYCGPKVHRSTEYDYIKGTSPQDITIVTELEQFYDLFHQNLDKKLSSDKEELNTKLLEEFDQKLLLLKGESLT